LSEGKRQKRDAYATASLSLVSAHLALLVYMIMSARYDDLVLLELLFSTGVLSIGALATHVVPIGVLLLMLCTISTFYSAVFISEMLAGYAFIFRWAPVIVVTYVSLSKRDKKSIEVIAGVMTLNLLLCLLFGFLGL